MSKRMTKAEREKEEKCKYNRQLIKIGLDIMEGLKTKKMTCSKKNEIRRCYLDFRRKRNFCLCEECIKAFEVLGFERTYFESQKHFKDMYKSQFNFKIKNDLYEVECFDDDNNSCRKFGVECKCEYYNVLCF